MVAEQDKRRGRLGNLGRQATMGAGVAVLIAVWLAATTVGVWVVRGASAQDRPAPSGPSATTEPVCPCCAASGDLPPPADWRYCPRTGQPLSGGGASDSAGQASSRQGGEISKANIWLAVGLVGQLAFAMRFLLQWLVSERAGESVVPPSFWWLSLVAGLMVLAYGLHRMEPVIILSQAFNPVVYIRNLVLIARKRRQAAQATDQETSAKGL